MLIPIVRKNSSISFPARAYENDAAFDLESAEDVTFQPGKYIVDIGTGLHIEIPPGMAGLILPRSSTSKKFNLWIPNAPGLIDPGFRGEVKVRTAPIDRTVLPVIHKGDKIAQLMFVNCANVDLYESEELSHSERGEQGWGSSG